MTVVLEDPASPLTLLEDGSGGSPSINVMLINIPAEGLQRELASCHFLLFWLGYVYIGGSFFGIFVLGICSLVGLI